MLVVWAIVSAVVCAYLLAAHTVTLPSPKRDDVKLTRAVAATRSAHERDKWFSLHVVYERCGCSRRVIEHLRSRGPRGGMAERVVLVVDGPNEGERDGYARQLTEAGFGFETLTSAELDERYGVGAVPLLITADASNRLRYVGGYTERKQGALFRDAEIFERLARGDSVQPLPIFGCPVSENLRRNVDPLRVR